MYLPYFSNIIDDLKTLLHNNSIDNFKGQIIQATGNSKKKDK